MDRGAAELEEGSVQRTHWSDAPQQKLPQNRGLAGLSHVCRPKSEPSDTDPVEFLSLKIDSTPESGRKESWNVLSTRMSAPIPC